LAKIEKEMSESKETTIYDIAAYLKISPATVSRGLKDHPAISSKTKKRILETAKELGYQANTFASNLRSKKTNTIGVIVPRLNSSFLSDVLAGIEKVVNASGYNLIISQSQESQKKEALNAATMFQNRVDGLLVSLSADTLDITHFEPFLKKAIPLLLFDRVINHEKISTVLINNSVAAQELTQHLIGQGARRIAYISGKLECKLYLDRFNGFKKALAEKSIEFDDNLLFECSLSISDGVDVASKLLALPQLPDAVFVGNDNCAAACILELKKHKVRVPDDLLMAGFNNDFISQVIEPQLTTIDYNGYALGELTAQTLINHLNQTQDISLTQSIVMRHELIVRKSTCK
jgi:LacI family transcriptional regulator